MSNTPNRPRVLSEVALLPHVVTMLEEHAELSVIRVEDALAWDAEAANYDVLILGGATPMNGERMDRIGSRVKLLARPGIGYDSVDIPAATERGIVVINTPDAPSESTAEHAIALMLNLTKGVATGDRILRAGKGFPIYGTLPIGLEAVGATLGLVGLGRIGGRVAEIARVLGMRVLALDPFISPERAQSLGVELVDNLADLLSVSDVVSLHCPSMPETYRLINATTLAQMKPGSFLVNVARGALIDEAALVDALQSGHLAGAGLDVFDPEPPNPHNPLFSLPNVVCTTHVGSYTTSGVTKMHTQTAEQIIEFLQGQRPINVVNPSVWGKHRQ